MSLVFNVDSDGVVYDWHGFMAPYLEYVLGKPVERWDTWDMAAQMGVSKKVFYEAFDRAIDDGAFRWGEPIDGAIEGLYTLVDAGHRVRLVTNKILNSAYKAEAAMRDTLRWYASHGLTHKIEFVFTGSKWGKDGYPADVVIDDKPDLSWVQPFPVVNVLFDQPWNRTGLENLAGVGEDSNFENPNLHRAVGWSDVLELVEQMGGGVLLDKSPVVV